MSAGPQIKRLVDLVDRGPEDDIFFPMSSDDTLFRRTWMPYHNVTPDIVEIGYKGNAAWGQRITVDLWHKETGDLLSWLCLRLKPRSWLGADLESKVLSGLWDYQDPSGAWMWAASLGSIAIQKVEFELDDMLIDTWSGEWMDIWSRAWLDGGRAAVWDSDIYGQLPAWEIHDTTRPPWTTVLPTEDGYVYCWLPLAFLRRPQSAFPMAALAEQRQVRVHITLRPFADVVRRRAVPRTSPTEVPLGETVVMLDKSGPTPVPWAYKLPTCVPGFEDTTVFAGVVQTEDPLRSAYMRIPFEMLYEPVTHMVFDMPTTMESGMACQVVSMQLPLRELNGPIRELCWFIRRKSVWRYNEWTNYGALMEDELLATRDDSLVTSNSLYEPILYQKPLLKSARIMVGNAVWQDDTEQWWRSGYGMAHRGGVRLAAGMVYGFSFGAGAAWEPESLQPAGTVNASRADIRLDLDIIVPDAVREQCDGDRNAWEVHVIGIGLNWMRFVEGMVAPLFTD
jgi:hypothetical protein